ncbi:hypothetical protein Trco_001580 [Trichoderma cornu-damae]|uniref:Uncharacterized protein n=1 Tax=Trichoderma cornu-damae TaxID=654480 RepID=A0A9P8QU64_9HYPO|nr:hypothetical protein Trco_001580 [Trichoderma cornu-damae]
MAVQDLNGQNTLHRCRDGKYLRLVTPNLELNAAILYTSQLPSAGGRVNRGTERRRPGMRTL